MQRLIIFYLFLTMTVICSFAMDFGLRFNSHSFPLEQRTSVSFGKPIEFDNSLLVGFHFNFYTRPLFGTLVSLKTDDGNNISIVASHQGQDAYLLGLVVNDGIKLMNGLISVDLTHEDKIDLSLDKKRNVAIFNYNNNEIELPVDLSKTKSATLIFGVDKENEVTDTAPIEVRNIRVFIDNKNTNFWDFKYHDTPNSRIDELGGVEAIVTNPHWLIDDHTDWRLIYSETVKDTRQTAFDPITERFYIVDNENIKVWSPLQADSTVYNIRSGFRPMAYSNHLVFDTISNSLVNYNLSRRTTARMTPEKGIWETEGSTSPNEEANYANHAFTFDGDIAYAFGGYGFYKFHNDLFKINLRTGLIEECKLQPELTPTTSAAAAVVGDKLYIFGGKGNHSGRQELPSKYQYTMHCYDTDTWNGELLWELDSVQYDFLPSQTMHYDPTQDCFYTASTRHGGELIKISRSKPEVSVISTPINSKMEYHDIVFDLYRSKDGKRYYLLMDKRLDPATHNYSIYTISAPFIDNPDIIHNKSLSSPVYTESSGSHWLLTSVMLAILVCAVIIYLLYRHRRAGKSALSSTVNDGQQPCPVIDTDRRADEDSEDSEADDKDLADTDLLFFGKRSDYISQSKFDRSKSAISLLGAFNVRSKTGEDITAKFTDRLKSLLILLLLANNKSDNGIKYQTIDEQIWSDKDEKSAQNNRNVYMRKLRILLEEVGDVPVTYEKGFFKIDCANIMYDYGEATARMTLLEANGNASTEEVNEILDLLLMGPLLPMTTYEWLDQYKADFSSRALEILTKLLKYELPRNEELSFKIAQTISFHEALSEEAMKAKCILLSRKKMVGQAKKVYTKFCKEYLHSLGEEYPLSFPEVCKSQI